MLARLAADGFDTLEFPLIDIAPVSDDALLRAALDELYGPRKYALVVFVSPNAVDYAFGKLGASWPADVPVGVVGPGSVAALARQGVAAPGYRVISPSAETTPIRVSIPKRSTPRSKRTSARKDAGASKASAC